MNERARLLEKLVVEGQVNVAERMFRERCVNHSPQSGEVGQLIVCVSAADHPTTMGLLGRISLTITNTGNKTISGADAIVICFDPNRNPYR